MMPGVQNWWSRQVAPYQAWGRRTAPAAPREYIRQGGTTTLRIPRLTAADRRRFVRPFRGVGWIYPDLTTPGFSAREAGLRGGLGIVCGEMPGDRCGAAPVKKEDGTFWAVFAAVVYFLFKG